MIAMHVVWRERERIQKLGIVPKPDVKKPACGEKGEAGKISRLCKL